MNHEMKRMMAFLLAGMLLLMGGCRAAGDTAEDTGPILDGPGYADLKESDTLVLYIMADNPVQQRRINQFTAATGISVDVVTVSEEEYDERIRNDLAAGSGPDILFTENLDLHVEKAARERQFLDLTRVMQEDPDFSPEDYLPGVFEACQVDGRQYTVPASYIIPVMISSEVMLDGFGFKWSRVDTASDFLSEIARLSPGAQNYRGFRQMLLWKNQFMALFRYSGIRLLDQETGEVLPDEKALRKWMEAYRAYYPYDEAGPDYASPSDWPHDLLTSGQCLFYCADEIANILVTKNIMWEKHHQDVTSVLPAQNGDTVGIIHHRLAIRANSPNSMNAWRFIKFMLSEEAQMDRFTVWCHPIHRGAMERVIREADAMWTNHGYIVYDYDKTALTTEQADELIAQLTTVDRFVLREPYAVYEMLDESMQPYFRGERSYEACATELRNKLTFYFSE